MPEAVTAPDDEATDHAGPRGTVVLFVLGLAWLAAYLWSAHASILGAGNNPIIAVIDAALALPGVIAATMLAGATAGVALRNALHRRRELQTWPALGVCFGAGTLIGLVAGGLILLSYGHRSSITVLAWAVLISGALGGLLGSIRPAEMISAGLAGTVAAYFIGFLLNLFQNNLLHLFGAGTSAQSQAQASSRLSLAVSLLSGLAAGLIAYSQLRRNRSELRFGAYLVAGATPGILLVAAEVVTRIGGAQLFGVIGGLDSADKAAMSYLGSARLNHALLVFFVGAIVSLIAFGRTLRPADRHAPAQPADAPQAEPAQAEAAQTESAQTESGHEESPQAESTRAGSAPAQASRGPDASRATDETIPAGDTLPAAAAASTQDSPASGDQPEPARESASS